MARRPRFDSVYAARPFHGYNHNIKFYFSALLRRLPSPRLACPFRAAIARCERYDRHLIIVALFTDKIDRRIKTKHELRPAGKVLRKPESRPTAEPSAFALLSRINNRIMRNC